MRAEHILSEFLSLLLGLRRAPGFATIATSEEETRPQAKEQSIQDLRQARSSRAQGGSG